MVCKHYFSDAAKQGIRAVLWQPGLRSALPSLLRDDFPAFAFLPRVPELWEEAFIDRNILGTGRRIADLEYEERQADFVCEFVASGERRCALIQEGLSKTRRQTTRVGTIEEPVVFEVKDQEAWYLEEEWNTFDRNRHSAETLRLVLQSPFRDYAVGMLTEFPRGFHRERPVHYGDARLQAALVSAAQYLMISSYDRQTWLFVPVR